MTNDNNHRKVAANKRPVQVLASSDIKPIKKSKNKQINSNNNIFPDYRLPHIEFPIQFLQAFLFDFFLLNNSVQLTR